MSFAVASTRFLIDTNVLVRSAKRDDALHQTALRAVTLLLPTAPLFLVPQNLFEFWAVATRPIEARGLGMTPRGARIELEKLKVAFQLLPDRTDMFAQWERIVTDYGVRGLPSHDARLVAAMKAHSLTHLLTFNASHFKRYEAGENIVVVAPAGL